MLVDPQTDDGQKVITIANPEQRSGELKIQTWYLRFIFNILQLK